MEYRTFGLAVRTVKCRLFGQTDISRWHDLSRFEEEWEQRTQLIARFIPRSSRVIEFGAGNCRLRRYLHPSSFYIPSDLVTRGDDTLVLDLNRRPLPDLSHLRADVAVFAGVWEYVADLPSFLPWLAGQFPECIASYECAHTSCGTLRRLSETASRFRAGWVNTYSRKELISLFSASGFFLTDSDIWRTPEGDEDIFVLSACIARNGWHPHVRRQN
jgi:hypothetical protein